MQHFPGNPLRVLLAALLCGLPGCDRQDSLSGAPDPGRRSPVQPDPVTADPLGQPEWRASQGVVLLAAEVRLPFHGSDCEPPEGWMVEVARECLALRGLRLEYLNVTRDRALDGTLAGVFDGALGVFPEEEARLVFPRSELARDPVAFVVGDTTRWTWTGPESLDGQVLGVTSGRWYNPGLDAWLFAHRRDPSSAQWADARDALRINLHKLLAGRITVLVDSEWAVYDLARRMGIVRYLKTAGRLESPRVISIGFSPATGRGPELAEAIDLGLAELRRTGRLERILADYPHPEDRP